MNTFKIKGEFIQLNQLIKAVGWVENGAQANLSIEQGEVKVNDAVEYRKRNKLYIGAKIEFQNQYVVIV